MRKLTGNQIATRKLRTLIKSSNMLLDKVCMLKTNTTEKSQEYKSNELVPQ